MAFAIKYWVTHPISTARMHSKCHYLSFTLQGKAGKQNSVCAPAPNTNGTSVSGSNSLSNGESNGLSNGIVTDVTDLTDTDGENDAT